MFLITVKQCQYNFVILNHTIVLPGIHPSFVPPRVPRTFTPLLYSELLNMLLASAVWYWFACFLSGIFRGTECRPVPMLRVGLRLVVDSSANLLSWSTVFLSSCSSWPCVLDIYPLFKYCYVWYGYEYSWFAFVRLYGLLARVDCKSVFFVSCFSLVRSGLSSSRKFVRLLVLDNMKCFEMPWVSRSMVCLVTGRLGSLFVESCFYRSDLPCMTLS